MIRRCDARTSPQNHLTGHKLAVVFAQRTGAKFVSGIRGVRARSPFPTVPKELLNALTARPCGMQPTRFKQISVKGFLPHHMFPFRFRWESATSPSSKRLGLEVTDVAHGRIKQRGKSVPAPQGEDPPASLIMSIPLPVERGHPRPLVRHLPAVREPESRARVSVIRHKLQILPARHIAVCDLKRSQVDLVTRSFIVKAEIERIAAIQSITNFNQPPSKLCQLSVRDRMAIFFRKRGGIGTRDCRGFEKNACLMSVSASSWCCCSWFRPNMTRRDVSSIEGAVKESLHLVVNVRAEIKDLLQAKDGKKKRAASFPESPHRVRCNSC